MTKSGFCSIIFCFFMFICFPFLSLWCSLILSLGFLSVLGNLFNGQLHVEEVILCVTTSVTSPYSQIAFLQEHPFLWMIYPIPDW